MLEDTHMINGCSYLDYKAFIFKNSNPHFNSVPKAVSGDGMVLGNNTVFICLTFLLIIITILRLI